MAIGNEADVPAAAENDILGEEMQQGDDVID